MLAEHEHEQALRRFAAARREVKAVKAEIAQQGSNLERVSRLMPSQQSFARADKDLAAKIRAWEACKEWERSPSEDD